MNAKQAAGRTGFYAGVAAEETVAQYYVSRGSVIVARRWRGKGGEIDLVVQDGDGFVFVEVKKSRDFARAAARLSRRQMDRLVVAASEFVADQPKGQLTDMRFDLALVDQRGAVKIIENAFMEA